MVKYKRSLILTSLLLTASAKAEAASEPMTLLCQWDISGGHYSRNHIIDEANLTLDGYSAKFTDSMITADMANKNGNVEHLRINRLNGDFSEGCEPCVAILNGHAIPTLNTGNITGKCEKAPETKKF